MKNRILFVALLCAAASAQADFREFHAVPADSSIQAALRQAAEETLAQNPKLKPEDLALSVIDLTDPTRPRRGDYLGDAPFYPASVVKLFFMAEIFHQQKETRPDVGRALHEMIAVSDNDAAAFLVDVMSGTCSGGELQGRALGKFIQKRGVANRWFASMGYDLSAMAKPWSFGPFGRDVQLMGPGRIHRNRASANDVASLLLWIVRRRAISTQDSEAMMALLARSIEGPRESDDQVKDFIGEALPVGSKLWSKAGWTSAVGHDAAYLELPDGRKWVLVVFTRNNGVILVPSIARRVLAGVH
jgi:beta-lactamase class A